jgi:hypothetical protein
MCGLSVTLLKRKFSPHFMVSDIVHTLLCVDKNVNNRVLVIDTVHPVVDSCQCHNSKICCQDVETV